MSNGGRQLEELMLGGQRGRHREWAWHTESFKRNSLGTVFPGKRKKTAHSFIR